MLSGREDNEWTPADILGRVLEKERIEVWHLDLLLRAKGFVPTLQTGHPSLVDL